MKLDWFKDKKWGGIELSVAVEGLKDLERLERAMKRFADSCVQAADASERIAIAFERIGLKIEEEEG